MFLKIDFKMGRTKKSLDEVSTTTLRWRKYMEKKKIEDPDFIMKKRESSRQNAKLRCATFTKEEKEAHKTKVRNAMRKKRAESNITNDKSIHEMLPYSSPYTLGKAVKKLERSLPKTKEKQIAVLQKYIKINGISQNELFPLRNELSEVEKLIVDFYYNPCIVYTAPGIADTMVVRDVNGKETVRKYYLTMFIREAYANFVQNYGAIVKLSKFHSLRPKNVLLMKDTPSEVCKCLRHENLRFSLLALGCSYDGSLWDDILCSSSIDSTCWKGNCANCMGFQNFYPEKQMDELVKIQQWEKSGKQLHLVVKNLSVMDILESLITKALPIYKHIHVKRVQSSSFENDKNKHNLRSTQFDFAMNFTSEVQKEVQSALWSRSSIVLFTVASKLNNSDLSMVIASQNVSKNKNTVFKFLQAMLERLPQIESTEIEEVFWSDGPASEFKNRFMVQVLKFFAKKYMKTFTWKYFATSHGKGVVDAIGGNVKNIVRMQMKANKESVNIVNNTTDFITIARNGLKDTIIFEVTEEQIVDSIK